MWTFKLFCVATYTSTQLINTTYYSEQFAYEKVVELSKNRNVANNSNFMDYFGILRTNIDSANNAISELEDIYASQNCLDKCKYLIDNPTLFN